MSVCVGDDEKFEQLSKKPIIWWMHVFVFVVYKADHSCFWLVGWGKPATKYGGIDGWMGEWGITGMIRDLCITKKLVKVSHTYRCVYKKESTHLYRDDDDDTWFGASVCMEGHQIKNDKLRRRLVGRANINKTLFLCKRWSWFQFPMDGWWVMDKKACLWVCWCEYSHIYIYICVIYIYEFCESNF